VITFEEYSRLVIRIKMKFYTGCILSLSGFSFAEAPSLPSGSLLHRIREDDTSK